MWISLWMIRGEGPSRAHFFVAVLDLVKL